MFRPILILCLALLGLSARAQQYTPIQVDIAGYRGNPAVSDTIRLLPADTLQALSVSARYAIGSQLVTPQPTLARKGLGVVVRFASSNTLPDLAKYELKVDTIIRWKGDVRVSYTGITLPSTSGTLLSGIYSQLGVLQGLYSALSGSFTSLSSFASFSAATNSTLASLASDIASRVPTSTYTTDKAGILASIALKASQSALDAANAVIASNTATIATKASQSALAATNAVVTANTGNISINTASIATVIPARVASFSAAKAVITTGTPKVFRIANNELFNCPALTPCPTHSVYDGTDWYHSPSLLQNN